MPELELRLAALRSSKPWAGVGVDLLALGKFDELMRAACAAGLPAPQLGTTLEGNVVLELSTPEGAQVSGEVDLSSLEVEAVVARSDTPAYRHFWMSLAETQEFVAAVMTPLAQ